MWPEHRSRCLLARDRDGSLQGYLFVRDHQLGPWGAIDASVAEALLRVALVASFEKAPYALVPRTNATCTGLLSEYGFVERRRLRHMRRGGSGPPGIPQQLFAQASFAHG